MTGDDQEPHTRAGATDRVDNLLARGAIAAVEAGNVDDRDRSIRVGDAITVRREIAGRFHAHPGPR